MHPPRLDPAAHDVDSPDQRADAARPLKKPAPNQNDPAKSKPMTLQNHPAKGDKSCSEKSAKGESTPTPELASRATGPDALGRDLPCFPCPHRSVCCKYGTALTPGEGRALLAEFGEDYVFYDNDPAGMWGAGQEFRTQTWNGRCAFHKDGGCMIHGHPHYPSMCRLFPFKDARNLALPHAYDATLCPEFVNRSPEDTPCPKPPQQEGASASSSSSPNQASSYP